MTLSDKLISLLSAFSVLLPFGALVVKRKLAWSFNMPLFFYVMNHFVAEVVTATLAQFRIRNLEVALVFNVIEGLLLISLYSYALKQRVFKLTALVLMPLYLAGFCSIYFMLDAKHFLPSYTYAFHEVVMLSVVLLFFIERIKLMDDLFIDENPMFYISCGFILFYAVSVFYFALHDYLFHFFPAIEMKGFWIHCIMLTIMNILLAKGIWQIKKV